MTSRRDENGTVAAHHTSSENLHALDPSFDTSNDIWAGHQEDLGPHYHTAMGDALGVAQSSFHPSNTTENEQALGTYSWYPESATPGSYMSEQYVDHSEFLTPSFGDTLQEPFDILLNIRDDDDAEVPGRSSSDQVRSSTLTDAQPAGEFVSTHEDHAFISDMTEQSHNTQLLSPELTNPSTPVTDRNMSPSSTYAVPQPHQGRVSLTGEHQSVNGTNAVRLHVETTGLQSDSVRSPNNVHQRTPSIQMHPPADNNDSGLRTGYDPHQRGGETVPSLEDMEEARQLEVNRQNVYQWLDVSDVEDPSSLKPKKSAGRRLRAKSASDLNMNQGISDANIPGPGIYIKEDDLEEEEDDDDDEEYDAEDEDLESSPIKDYQHTTDEIPKPADGFIPDEAPDSAHITQRPPWVDVPAATNTNAEGSQPYNSNAAMAIFQRRAKELDRVSIAATIGSRRKSFSDMGSIYSGADSRRNSILMSEHVPAPRSTAAARRPAFLNRVISRANSNTKKRKESESSVKPDSPEALHARQGSQGNFKTTDRTGMLGQNKSPPGDKRDAASPISAISLTPTSPFKVISGALRRSRSRSELSTAGLGEMLAKQGGPPMLSLPKGSPEEAMAQATRSTPIHNVPKSDNNEDESDDEDDSSPISANIAMNLKIRNDNIIPTHEGFKIHVKVLNPRLEPYMVERVAAEQLKRYKRLLDNRLRHARVGNKCASGKFCSLQGGNPEYGPPRNSGKGDAQAVIFYITPPPQDALGEESENGDDSSTVMANFPDGIPVPPVDRLPAKFECPLCFQVKSISKPSDWTKHVHEDLQPFTCTFPDCSQPKSFKRKADWVRHENELHRQLEKWVCSLAECPKRECYRKNNFVHHLAREHHLDQRTTGRTIVPRLVQECRVWNEKQPGGEPCRFCHNLCPKWKILNVHLAKHLEQISMPLFPLVDAMAGNYPHAQKPLGMNDSAVQAEMARSSPFEGQMMPQGSLADNWVQPYYDNVPITSGNMSHGGFSDPSSPSTSADFYKYTTNQNATPLSIPANAIQSHSALQRQYAGGNQLLSANASTSAADNRYSPSANTYPPPNLSPRNSAQQVMPTAYLQSDVYTTSPVDGPILSSSTQAFSHPGMSAVTYPPVSGAYVTEPGTTQFYDASADHLHYNQAANNGAYGHDGMHFSNSYMQGTNGAYQDDQQLDHQHQHHQSQQRPSQSNNFYF